MRCQKCDHEMQVGEWPFCPHEKGTNHVIGDDIPGGLVVKHGACWPDGTPRRHYSKSSIRKAAYENGFDIFGETPKPNPRIVERDALERELKNKRG